MDKEHDVDLAEKARRVAEASAEAAEAAKNEGTLHKLAETIAKVRAEREGSR